jgi:hypothetical protein
MVSPNHLDFRLHLIRFEGPGEAVLNTVGTGESSESYPSEAPLCSSQSSELIAGNISVNQQIDAGQPEKLRRDPWRKALWWLLAAAFLFQAYYVREMLAALVIFTILFVIGAIIAGAIYLVGRAGETTVTLAEPVARRGVALAEELRQKAFRRPHSAPAP